MRNNIKKQSGFTLVEVLLIVLILSVIGFAGYSVWNNQQEKNTADTSNNESVNENSDQETVDEASEPDISANWKRYTSGMGAYSIKIVDGMTGLRETTSDLIVVMEYNKNNSPASLTDTNGVGGDGGGVLTVYQAEDSQAFSSTEKLELKEETITTTSGVKGTKQTFKTPYSPPCEGPGCYVGTEYVTYEFKDEETGMVTHIVYSRRFLNEETAKVYNLTQDDPDLSTEIDAVAKSLEIY